MYTRRSDSRFENHREYVSSIFLFAFVFLVIDRSYYYCYLPAILSVIIIEYRTYDVA